MKSLVQSTHQVRRNKLPRSKPSLMPLPQRRLRSSHQNCPQQRRKKWRKRKRSLMLLPRPRKRDLITNHQRRRSQSKLQRLRPHHLLQPHLISHQSLPEPLPNIKADLMLTNLTPTHPTPILTAMTNEPIFIKVKNTLLLFELNLTKRLSVIVNI